MTDLTGKMGGLIKNPIVLAVGAALGIMLIVAASRANSGSGSSGGVLTQSQAIASQTNIALGAQTTAYNLAALDYMAAQAGVAAGTRNSEINATTAVVMHTLDNTNNINAMANNLALQRGEIAGSLKLNDANKNAMLEAARIQTTTAITLAPIAAAMTTANTRIAADAAVSMATINANSAATLATINAASRSAIANTQAETSTTNSLLGIVGTVAGAYFGGPAGAAAGGAVGSSMSA